MAGLTYIQIAFDGFAIKPDRFKHPRCRRSWRNQQCLNEPAGVFGVKANHLPPCNDFFGSFARVGDDKRGHRTPFNRSGPLNDTLVRARHACDKPLFLLFFSFGWHVADVCRRGVHCKDRFLRTATRVALVFSMAFVNFIRGRLFEAYA